MAESISQPAGDVAARRAKANGYLRREAGLPELCDEAMAWMPRVVMLAVSLAATVPALVVIFHDHLTRWQQATLSLLIFTVLGAGGVTVAHACTPDRRRPSMARLAHWTVFSAIGVLVLAGGGFIAYHGVIENARIGDDIKAYNLALALVAVGVYLLAASGGGPLLRAVLGSVWDIPKTMVRSAIGAMPELVGLVAFVVILQDVWRLVAPMTSWRVEVLLLLCVLFTVGAIVEHLRTELYPVWRVKPQDALVAAGKNGTTRAYVDGVVLDTLDEVPLRGRERWNAVLLVVLPLTIRVLIAAMILTVILFVVGLLVMDTKHLDEVAPGVPLPVAAAKVAGALSAIAAAAYAVTNKHRSLQAMAAPIIENVTANLGVWVAYRRPREGVPEPVPAPLSAPAPAR